MPLLMVDKIFLREYNTPQAGENPTPSHPPTLFFLSSCSFYLFSYLPLSKIKIEDESVTSNLSNQSQYFTLPGCKQLCPKNMSVNRGIESFNYFHPWFVKDQKGAF